MLKKIGNLDVRPAVNIVNNGEAVVASPLLPQLFQHLIDVTFFVREDLGFDEFWPVFKASFGVRHTPQTDKEQPG